MRRLLFLLVILALWPATGQAAVRISFYSHDFGEYYPHAFVVVSGKTDATGEAAFANYGWTSTAQNILLVVGRPSRGVVTSSSPDYVRSSTEEFSLLLTDAEYQAALQAIETWRSLPQPSYSLAEANCIHFVAAVARAVGLEADPRAGLMLKPKAFLRSVYEANAHEIATRAVQRPPPGPVTERPLAQPLIDAAGVVY